ncbi:hypothetical protein HNE_2610 [Hyphomonas neptunium ATCC 15444]|uniref:Uncharacterized protein n=1 Tax=Hyphomonas neptunium (strain ATCC 15444) TaxID=228405 RepID=Q0BYZ4_HYPNA|nr:hypothetical protein HNE_2610 [Hyphomonas neptunium ATCC 15444]
MIWKFRTKTMHSSHSLVSARRQTVALSTTQSSKMYKHQPEAVTPLRVLAAALIAGGMILMKVASE